MRIVGAGPAEYDQAVVEFTLDGKRISAQEGELLVHAAARVGTFIPTLCHDDKLDPYGGCRMCLVDLEGAPRPVPACAQRVREGMVVSTNGENGALRKTLTEMLLAEHLSPNPGGRPNELTDLAEELDAQAPFLLPDAGREQYDGPQQADGLRPRRVHPLQPLRALHAGGHAVLGARVRGARCRGPRRADARPLLARHRVRALRRLPLGVPDRGDPRAVPRAARRPGTSSALVKTKTTCTFCGVGCQIDLNVDPKTERIVKVTSDPGYVSNDGNLCVKGRFAFNFVHHPDRLTQPLVRGEDGELHPADWDTALRAAAEGLSLVRERHGPQSIGILASARLTNEENYLLQKLARGVIGTNSIHSCEAT